MFALRRFAASMVGTTLTAAAFGPGASASPGPQRKARQTGVPLRSCGGRINHAEHVRHQDARRLRRPQSRVHSIAVIEAVAKATGLSAKGAERFAVDAASAYCPL